MTRRLPGDQPRPQCPAMVVCERSEVDPMTDRLNLYGILQTTHTGAQDMCVYFTVVGQGEYDAELVLEHKATGGVQPLGGRRVEVPAGASLLEQTVPLKTQGFAAPGTYLYKLYIDGDLAAVRRVDVLDRPGVRSLRFGPE